MSPPSLRVRPARGLAVAGLRPDRLAFRPLDPRPSSPDEDAAEAAENRQDWLEAARLWRRAAATAPAEAERLAHLQSAQEAEARATAQHAAPVVP